jgi:hypothetical protein
MGGGNRIAVRLYVAALIVDMEVDDVHHSSFNYAGIYFAFFDVDDT